MKKRKPYFFILLFVAAHFVHHLLTSLLAPLLPLIRDDFNFSYAQAGAVVSAFSISYGIGQLPAGWVADRISPKYLLLLGISGVAVAGALLGLNASYIGLIIFLIVMGIAGGGYHPAAAPLISASVPTAQRGRAIGFHILGGSISHFLAPVTAVFLAGLAGWRGSYIITAVPVFIFGILLFAILRRNDIRAGKNDAEADPKSKGVDSEVRGERYSRIILFLIMTASISAVVGSSLAFFPLYLVDKFGLHQRTAALFLSFFYLVGMISAPVGGSIADRFGLKTVFFFIAVLSGPSIILFGVSPNWIFLAFTITGLAIISFFRMTISETFFITNVPLKKRSTILGIYFFAGMEGNGIITPFLGRAIDTWGFSRSFLVLGIILSSVLLVCLVISFLLSKGETGVQKIKMEKA